MTFDLPRGAEYAGRYVLGISQVHTPGGKGANQAVAAGLLGTHTTFVGAVGDDDAGRIVEATFRRFEIDATRLARSTAPTGAAIVCVAETGENAIIVISGANAAFGADDVRSSIEQIRSADAVVLQAEISLEANQAAVEVASKSGTPVIMNMAPVPRDINPYLPLLASCEVLILNEVEEAALVASGARLHTLGPELIVTTLGEHGVRWWHKGIQGSMEAINPAAAIIDTVGAGDAFAHLVYECDGVFRDQAEIEANTIDYSCVTGKLIPGDMKFKDVDGDGKITADDQVRLEENTTPKFNFGGTLSLTYGNFDLSMLLQGAAGASLRVQTESGDIGNFLKYMYDNRWRIDNPTSEHPRLASRGDTYFTGGNYGNNTYYLFSKDYLRLKNIELGYNLPTSLVDKVGLGNLRIYVNALNLLTFDKHGLFDPETESQSGVYYPQARVLHTGLNVTF